MDQSKIHSTSKESSQFSSSSFELSEVAQLSGGGGDGGCEAISMPARLQWTPQLHKRFVDAVAHLGIDNAQPKTILQMMSIDGLTEENVASHLQKYHLSLRRMQGLNNSSGTSDSKSCLTEPDEPKLTLFCELSGGDMKIPPEHISSESVESPLQRVESPLQKVKVVWTPQLHKKFVDAVAHLGIKNAVPKTIIPLMSVDGLTKENVASHLQKYRLYLKRMQGLNNGGSNGGSGGSGDAATDHLFASSPVPPHFLHQECGGGGGGWPNSDYFSPYMSVAALTHHHQMATAQQIQAEFQQHHTQIGQVGGQFQHPLSSRQAQLGPNRYDMLQYNNNSGLVEDVESATPNNGARKLLPLFPTRDHLRAISSSEPTSFLQQSGPNSIQGPRPSPLKINSHLPTPIKAFSRKLNHSRTIDLNKAEYTEALAFAEENAYDDMYNCLRTFKKLEHSTKVSQECNKAEYTEALAFAEENAYDDMYNCFFKKLEHSTKVSQECLDCLVYCSLFPKDYEIDRDTLIQLWMAEDLIKEEPMEDIAASYLRALCKHGEYISLLREDYGTGKIWYKVKRFEISEQVLEISKITPVRAISEDPTSVLSATETENYHVTLQRLLPTDLRALGRFSNISTLLLLRNHKAIVASIPYDFFMSLQHLRALDLSKTKISELPSSIGNARCLRYLDLSETPIKRLPETTEFLLNLQTLKLQNCPRLVALPKATRKLMCLRHLDLGTVRHMHSMPAGMGALTSLRTLTEFIAGREQGCRIRELKNMNDIEGKLCLSKLENVVRLDDAKEANLSRKRRLKNLELRWTDDEHQESIGVNHEVIKNLHPHTDLQDLRIICYGGSTFPSWISHPSFVKLTKITLFKCPSCQILPSLGQLPLLESLSLIELAGVRIIDFHFRRDKLIAAADDNDQFVAFPALQKLEIKSMLSLEKWSDIEKVDFPCLRKFSIKDCPKLAALFELTNTNALEYLELNQCTKLLSLPEENLPASLKTLMIEGCPSFSLSRSVDKNSDWIEQQHSPSLSIYQRNEKLERNE